MSSIYKKGRDGYYYYQAYVYNSESKKKDKRVFHALRTKDLDEAKSKQVELDSKYDAQEGVNSDSQNLFYNLNLKRMIAVIAGIILIINVIINYSTLFNPNQNKNDAVVSEKVKNNKKDINIPKNNINHEQQIINNQNDLTLESIPKIKRSITDSNMKPPKIDIPDYTIERVERLSDLFKQGKVYVTVNEKTSSQSQRLLCEKLMKQFSEFSNIVICLYANNSIGKGLAKGNDDDISVIEKKKFWLAMYTFNSVEGEYFDDNPSSYLGIN